MRMSSKMTLALSTLMVLGLLVAFAGLFGARSIVDTGRPSAAVSLAPVQAVVDSPLPSPAHPTEEIVVITPPPDGGVIVLEPGKVYVFPSPTPFPTWTPRPTPTRRPGPTATPMPLPKPAPNAEGNLYFTSYTLGDNQQIIYSHFSLHIDGQGNASVGLQDVNPPKSLGFTPYQIVISPDHRYTLYMEAVEPGVRPYVYNSATGETHVLFDDYGGGQFYGWHPDGRHFLFWIDNVSMWLIDAETLDMIELAYPKGPVQGAAISPDGLIVAYIAEDRPTIGAMWFVSTAGSDATPQFDAGNTSFMYPNAWAPTNDRLLYHGDCPPSTFGTSELKSTSVCIFHRAEQTFAPLKLLFAGYPPSWSPDGHYIASTGLNPDEQLCEKSEIQSNPDKCLYQGRMLYIADTATDEVRPLTRGIVPVWSPDGSTIAFLSDRTGSPEIWIIGVDGKGEQQITTIGRHILPRSLTWLRGVQ